MEAAYVCWSLLALLFAAVLFLLATREEKAVRRQGAAARRTGHRLTRM